ncbi:MAG: ATP-binding protein [Eubacteriales bacterium]|nr:ATP-binding protein [Eubacteriales bacterium]
MGVTSTQYREILNEYDQIRRDNELIQQNRQEEIYEKIPDIQTINETIASESIKAAKSMLFHPESKEQPALHDKIVSLTRQKRELLIRGGYPADYLDPIYRCSYCKDTGYVQQDRCFCFENKIRNILFEQSNLTEAIKEHNFDTFQIRYYSNEIPAGAKLSPRQNMYKVLDLCKEYLKTFSSKPGQNLLIHGNAGVGKTFLSTCLAAEAIKAGHSVLYLTSYQLFEQLAEYTFHREKNQENPRPLLMDTDLLIIDDLGTEMNNSFINSELFLCINERILNKKSTIINTNFSLKQINQTYTERISSRLIQFYTILHIYGEDIRIKKAFSTIDE